MLPPLREHFGLDADAWGKCKAYAGLLATDAYRLGLVRFDPHSAGEEVIASLLLMEVLVPGPLVDVGSGAGLPGIPLAIAVGAVTLAEPRRRAVAFLEKAARTLEVDLEVIPAPAEELAGTDRREGFHTVTARAVAPPPVALELAAPLAAPGGAVVLTGAPSSEAVVLTADSRRRLGISPPELVRLSAPGGFHRNVHIVKKTGPTEVGLPRQAASARRTPLR